MRRNSSMNFSLNAKVTDMANSIIQEIEKARATRKVPDFNPGDTVVVQVKVKEGEGCFECRGTGYYGRTGIFEILPVDDAIKPMILKGGDAPEIKREATKNGMRTLRQSALRKLAEGVTTFEEVVRVTGL